MSMKKKLILLAASNADFRQSFKDLLELQGYEVLTAGNVHDAIDTLKLSHGASILSLALVDLHLGSADYRSDTDGLDVIVLARLLGVPCVEIHIRSLARAFVDLRDGPEAILNAVNNILQPT